jgi:SAM-dependent methyltransferase
LLAKLAKSLLFLIRLLSNFKEVDVPNFKVRDDGIVINKNDLNFSLKFFIINDVYKNLGLKDFSVLDIGCAGGLYTFLPCFFGSKAALGIDVENRSIGGNSLFKNRLIKYWNLTKFKNVRFKKLSFFDLPEKSFDVIHCLGIIHHLIHLNSKLEFDKIVNKLDKICDRVLLIEWVPTGSYGPYANKPYITKSDFVQAFKSKFSEFQSVGYTTEYNDALRENRELYIGIRK